MITQEEILEKIRRVGLRTSEVVKMGEGMVSFNQASQWVNCDKHGRNLSVPVILMLNFMCDIAHGEIKAHAVKKDVVPVMVPKENSKPENKVKPVKIPINKSKSKKEDTAENNNGLSKKCATAVDGIKGVPEGAFSHRKDCIYFNYKGAVYGFVYSDQEEVRFEYKGFSMVVRGEFERVFGQVEVDDAE